MMRVEEKDLIPVLKEAKEIFTEKILNDDPSTVEQAEKIEAAITQAMDIIFDYKTMADAYTQMMTKYEKEQPVIKRGMDFYQCPACGKRTGRNHSHCHWCGKKLGWNR